MNIFRKIKDGLSKTQEKLVLGFGNIFSRGSLDDDAWEELEMVLLTADIGHKTASDLIAALRKKRPENMAELRAGLVNTVTEMLAPYSEPLTEKPPKPYCIIIAGVNGVGKTTTIAKLCNYFVSNGRKVVVGAADTFRAAAIEQLEVWAKRTGVEIVKQREGADPAAVAYDSLRSALSSGADILIIDTAGRLHTKSNLMDELKKIKRVLSREGESYPQECLLVLDATLGQNALSQARTFNDAIDITGIIMTKLDGTSKGGILINVVRELKVPVRFIGVGEKMDDLQPFDARSFAEGIF